MKWRLAVALGIIAVLMLAFVLGATYFFSRSFHSRPSKPLPTGPVIAEARSKANREVIVIAIVADDYFVN